MAWIIYFVKQSILTKVFLKVYLKILTAGAVYLSVLTLTRGMGERI